MSSSSIPALSRLPVPLAKGLATFVPGVLRWASRAGAGGTEAAPYCYGVWLKHASLLHDAGLRQVTGCVAEIGPGQSLGVGLAALLCGASHCRSLDVIRLADPEKNLRVLNDLIDLFRRRAPRPEKGWPDYDACLDEHLFPSALLPERWMDDMLRPDRLAAIRAATAHPGQPADGILLSYVAPWTGEEAVPAGAVDIILSHSVLEHVADLEATYRACARWLRPGGWMSHQIDFTSHGLTPEWNGYRRHGEWLWGLIAGKRPWIINREPFSRHLDLVRGNGLEIVREMAWSWPNPIGREHLAPRWRALSDLDLATAGALVQARKP